MNMQLRLKSIRRVLSVAVVVAGLLSVTLAFVLPLYSDEVVTRLFSSRFFFDDRLMTTLYPQCSSTLNRLISPLFYPAAFVLSVVYEPLGPLGVRISGVIISILVIAMFGLLCRNRFEGKEGWFDSFAVFLGVCLLGVMPFQMTMVRAEQILLFSVLFFLIVLNGAETRSRFNGVFFLSAFVLAMVSYSHPKVIFFAPFIVYVLWKSFRRKPWLLVSLLVYFCLLVYKVGEGTRLLFLCQDAPSIAATMARHSLDPSSLFIEPIHFFKVGLGNLRGAVGAIVGHLYFSQNYQSGWLVGHDLPLGKPFIVFNYGIRWVLCSFIYLANVLPFLYVGILVILRKKVSASGWASLLLATANIGNFFLYMVWGFYSGAQVVGLSAFILALILPDIGMMIDLFFRKISEEIRRFFRCMAALLSGVSLLSMSYLVGAYVYPSYVANYIEGAEITGQPFSIPVLSVDSRLSGIKALARQCGFHHDETLIVDHFTYFALKEFKRPMHTLYVGQYYGQDIEGRLAEFLPKRNSRGGVSRCSWVPTELRKFIRYENDGYCCFILGK